MTDPAGALAARIERFEQAADPELIWDPAALSEAEQAMRACAGDRSDAATWRLIGMLHLARYRLDQRTTQDAAVAGAFFAAVAVVDPGRLPEKLRGANVPPGESADTWAGLVEEVFRHVDPATYRHVGLLIHNLVRRAMANPSAEVADRLGELLLQESMRSPDPSSWAPGALEPLGAGLLRLYGLTGEREVVDDAVHVLFRAALMGPGESAYAGELAAALGMAAAGDDELVRAYLRAAESAPGGQDRSQALLALVDLTQARAAASYADGDLLAFIRVGQCALDFWHERWAHPAVLAPYAAGLIEWFVVTGNERSLEAGMEMLEALHVTPDETARGLGTDPLVRLELLGDRRWRRYGVTGDLADLNTAVDVIRETARLASSTGPSSTGPSSTGPSSTGPSSTGPSSTGPSSTGPPSFGGHPDRARYLANLANALLRRAVVTGGDPAEPIAAARAAVAAYRTQDPARATALLLLAQALKLRLTLDGADEAAAALREALTAGERLAFRAEAYGLLSEVLRWRAAHGAHPTENLHEAVTAARQGVELALKTSRDQPAAQRTLCRALLARFSAHGDTRDLGEALALAGDGDTALLTELSTALDTALDPAPATEYATVLDPAPGGPVPVDEQLARAATDLALRTTDEDVALKLLRFAERRATTPGERGEYLLEAALHLSELGRHGIAGNVLERAAEVFDAAGLRTRTAYALARLGAGHEDLGELERALEAYGRSAAVYHEVGEPRAEALQLGGMGIVLLRAGHPARAVQYHLRAIALCEGAGLAVEEAAHQGHAAEAYLAAGDPAGAVTCAARARELYLGLGETESAALALVPAARAAVDEGDLTAAGERIAACAIELEAAGAWEEACQTLDAQAVLLAGRGHRAQAAACEARLVEIVRRRGQRREPADEWYRIAQRRRGNGDTDGARLAFELAEREYESIAHHDGAGSVRYNLGVLAYAEGSPERALEELGVAREIFARLRAPAKEAAALTLRASCLAALDHVEDALADLDRAMELAAAEGDLEALLTATLGRAALDVELGELREAGERLYSALGLAAGDPLKEAVVRDRLAGLAARTGDGRARVEALEQALAGFRAGGQDRLAALGSIKLGFALEERGEFRRARAALEDGLAGLASAADLRTSGPFEVIAALAGDLDAAWLTRLAAIQLGLGDLPAGRSTLTQALTTLRAAGHHAQATHLEVRLRIEEAEAAGDPHTLRTLAERALGERALAEQSLAEQSPTSPPDRSYLLTKLSPCCLALGDPAAAYEYAARGYELADRRIIEHLRNLGAAARALGRTDEAVERLLKAVELARDADTALPAQLARSLGLLAAALTDQARWAEAARAYEEGLALIEAPIWKALRVPLLSGRAALHLKLGELDQAATRFRQAIAMKEESGDTTGLADAYADLSLTHHLLGTPAQARPLAERALDLSRNNERATVLALLALAHLTPEEPPRWTSGPDKRNLRPHHLHSHDLAQHDQDQHSVDDHAHDKRGLDEHGLEEHDQQEAALLGEALALAQEIGFSAGEAVALSRLGILDLAMASPARARRRLSTAIDLLTELGHDLELATAYHHRSIAEEELGNLTAALTDAEQAHALGHEPSRDRAIRLALHLNQGMTAWTLAETAKTPSDHRPAPSEVPAELAAAEQHTLNAIKTLRTAAHNTRDPEQAASLLRRAHATQADLEALWDRMAPLAPDHVSLHRPQPLDQPALATLLTTLANPSTTTLAGPTTASPTSPETAPQTAPSPATPTGRSTAAHADRDAAAGVDFDPAASVAPDPAVAQTGPDTADPAGSNTGAHTDPGTAAYAGPGTAAYADPSTAAYADPSTAAYVGPGTAARIGPDAAIHARLHAEASAQATAAVGVIAFYLPPADGTVTVLVHRTGWSEPRAFATEVDRALLADFLNTTNGRRPDLLDIEARRRRAYLWRHLADLLLADALSALGDDDLALLHLIPHAELHRVPIHALAPDGRLLLERFPVAYAPSVTVLADLTRRRTQARNTGSLVLGHTPDISERPVIEAETDEVADLLGTTPYKGRDATAARLPGSWDIVHLACHATFGRTNPGIRLADGILTPGHLGPFTTNLLILSAHESRPHGSGTKDVPRPGEGGVATLGRTLLQAGARSAVLTLWPVSAEITRALMRDFHTRLRVGTGHAEALRAAVLGLRDLYGPAEPDLWAAYILTGLPASATRSN